MSRSTYIPRGQVVFTLLALACMVLAFAAPRAEAQSCQVPPELMALARTLAAVPPDQAEIPAVMTERLAAQMAEMSESRVIRTLRENGLDSLSTISIDLMAEAARIGRGGSYHPKRTRSLLRDFDEQSILACTRAETSIFQNIQNERVGGVFTESGINLAEVERRAEEDKLFAAGAVVAAMAIFILGMVLIDTGIRWAMALLYNRKACRIPAELLVGASRIEGLVLTLGKGGCRFHPLNVIAFDAALSELRADAATINIEGTERAVRCSGIYDTVTDFRFDRPLTIKQQRILLQNSTISPYYIRKARDGGVAATDPLV